MDSLPKVYRKVSEDVPVTSCCLWVLTQDNLPPDSIASAVHSWIGNVQAGTFFAGCQSAAMAATGYGAATLGAVTQTGVILSISGTALASKWLGSKERRLLGPKL